MASGEPHEKGLPLEHGGSSGGNQQVPVSLKSSESTPTSSGITNAFSSEQPNLPKNPNKESPQSMKVRK